MIVGLSYFLISVALPLIMLLIRSTSKRDGEDVDEFRYESSWAPLMLGCSGLPILLALMVVILMWPNVSAIQFAIVFSIAAIVSCYFIYGYKYLKEFCIFADNDGIDIHTVWNTRRVRFDRIDKIVLLQGGRGEEVLEVYDKSKKKIIRLTDSLSDLRGLCGLLRMRAGKFGAVYKHRDMWGKWS